MPAVAVAPRSRSGRLVRGEAATGAKGPVLATLARMAASGPVLGLGHVRDKHRQARSQTRWSHTRDPARRCTLRRRRCRHRERAEHYRIWRKKKAINKIEGNCLGGSNLRTSFGSSFSGGVRVKNESPSVATDITCSPITTLTDVSTVRRRRPAARTHYNHHRDNHFHLHPRIHADRPVPYDQATTTQTRCLDQAAVVDALEAVSHGHLQHRLLIQLWCFPTHLAR